MRMPYLVLLSFAALLGFDPCSAEAKDCCLLKPCRSCNACCSSGTVATNKRSLNDDVLNALANRYQSGLAKEKSAARSLGVKDRSSNSALDRLEADLRPYMGKPSARAVGDRSAKQTSERDVMLLAGIAAKVLMALKNNPDADGLDLAETLIGDLLPFLSELKPSKPSKPTKPGSGGSVLTPDDDADPGDDESDTSPQGSSPEKLTAQLKVLATQLANIAAQAKADREAETEAVAQAQEKAANAQAKKTADAVALQKQLEKTKAALQDAVNAVQGTTDAPAPPNEEFAPVLKRPTREPIREDDVEPIK